MTSLSRRLDKLQAKIAPPKPDDGRPTEEEINERVVENLEVLLATMAPENIAHLEEEVARYVEDKLSIVDLSPLMQECVRMVRWHSGSSWPSCPDFPLAMPPEVARVWLEEDDVEPIDRCRACHYPLPAKSYFYTGPDHRGVMRTHTPRPAVSYFTTCPVCGSDDLQRIQDNKGVWWDNGRGCYFQAGRRIERHQVVNGRVLLNNEPEKGH